MGCSASDPPFESETEEKVATSGRWMCHRSPHESAEHSGRVASTSRISIILCGDDIKTQGIIKRSCE
eukprot:2293090-Amphidinium_carterae.1